MSSPEEHSFSSQISIDSSRGWMREGCASSESSSSEHTCPSISCRSVETESGSYVSPEYSENTENETGSCDEPGDKSYRLKKDSICPICFCKFRNLSLLGHCYHAFCLSCIKMWAKISNKCPLCNSYFTFAYHEFSSRSPLIYKKLDFVQSACNNDHSDVLDCGRHDAPSDPRYISSGDQPSRREVYVLGLYPKILEKDPPEFPVKVLDGTEQQEKKINKWIERDLSAIFPDTDMSIIAMHVIGCIKSSSGFISEEIVDGLKEYLDGYAHHFALELVLFSMSKLTVDAYDRLTKYAKLEE